MNNQAMRCLEVNLPDQLFLSPGTPKYTGNSDIGLTPQGEDEARDVGQRFPGIPFAHVLTSPPLQRAQHVRWQP